MEVWIKNKISIGKIMNALILFFLFSFINAAEKEKIGDESDGSRATPTHIIKLIDQDSSVIRMDRLPLLPFSTKKTCGACHDYNKISGGWHFNAGDSINETGRPGQPWIYVDPYSATQIPLSLREWPGTFKPQDIGMTPFEFISKFGRHMPGGGIGEREKEHSLEMIWRWRVSGELEINCLSCHDAERAHHQSESALQVLRENYRWAATASSGFATVRGSAKNLPDNYDIYYGASPDQADANPPKVVYQKDRFNDRGEIFIDISRKVDSGRCYFCHSTKTIDPDQPERWRHEEDVHLKAGLLCVDCHRHGLDHKMVRGYKEEAESENDLMTVPFSCKGCHIGSDDDVGLLQGRLGAPKPTHDGIPAIHFEKLSCTTCHSGSWPQEKALNVKTSMAHALGLPNANKNNRALPHIQSPVFIRQTNGVIAPHNLVWPSFWAEQKGDEIQPIDIELINPVARQIILHLDSLSSGDWPVLHDTLIVQILDSLVSGKVVESEPVYVSNGQIYSLDQNSMLVGQEHEIARPYSWPIAHDVRPAGQSLGVRGCEDCHSTDSGFYFGEISPDSPAKSETIHENKMTHYLETNSFGVWVFSFSFLFRPWLKYFILFACVIIGLVVILYLFRGLSRLITFVSVTDLKNRKGKRQ